MRQGAVNPCQAGQATVNALPHEASEGRCVPGRRTIARICGGSLCALACPQRLW